MEIELICDYCHEIFLREKRIHNQKLKRGFKKTYCSRRCKDNSQISRITFNCDTCGKEATISLSNFAKSKSGKHYCSKSCATTGNNRGNKHNYKNGRSTYREKALRLYGSRCSVCGYDIEPVLVIHHKDGNRNNNCASNLDVLCPTHHTEYHCGIRKYK